MGTPVLYWCAHRTGRARSMRFRPMSKVISTHRMSGRGLVRTVAPQDDRLQPPLRTAAPLFHPALLNGTLGCRFICRLFSHFCSVTRLVDRSSAWSEFVDDPVVCFTNAESNSGEQSRLWGEVHEISGGRKR